MSLSTSESPPAVRSPNGFKTWSKARVVGTNPFWVSFGGTREASVPGPDLGALGGLQKGFVPADGSCLIPTAGATSSPP